ncbi:MAG TPA: single-stranded DNA-binding protein [Acidimicrobiales bacterium]|nr:single-stranded DNA-binding protein [Acidimicrobiales bacterium]
MNVVVLAGRLSSPPQEKLLESGTRLMSLQVTVPGDAKGAESVPVVWFDAPARAVEMDEGEEVVVVGRVRRRFFRAGGATQSRTEVLADSVVAARRVAAVRSSLAGAVERLAAALDQAGPAGRRSGRR